MAQPLHRVTLLQGIPNTLFEHSLPVTMRLHRKKPVSQSTASGAAANCASHSATSSPTWQSRLKSTRHALADATRRHWHRTNDTASEQFPADPANSIRYFANPGPDFEQRDIPATPAQNPIAKAVAFYLPQFHAFPENDAWWGEGFTEWRNVARGTPRYQGHYQPRIPRDLGFYDLNDPDVIKAQAALARAAGIQAFCFYYYWFNGKRLMEGPLDTYVQSDIDQEFCIMWANENWTRRWDGRDQDVLIAQDYKDTDEDAFLVDTASYMAHPRYMRVGDRPLFVLYRASLIPDTVNTVARWRKKWTELLGVEPWVYMIQSYDDRDPQVHGMDGAIEFPPHKVSRDIQRRNHEHQLFDPDYSGQIRAYQDVVAKSLNEPVPAYPLIKTVSPSWDNDARREGRGVTFQGSTPEAYSQWLSGAIEYSHQNPVEGESFVFINAWNEWAEAAYLEPDVHFGHAYLNTTYRTLTQASAPKAQVSAHTLQASVHKPQGPPLLLVGHDAHANGAQLLLLSLARYYKHELGLPVTILLKGGGALLSEYEAIAPVTLLDSIELTQLQDWFTACGCQYALFNTSVTGDLLPAAKAAKLKCVSMVHEMPALIVDFNLQRHINDIAHEANHIVFPSTRVQQGFETFEPVITSAVHIRAQGLYKNVTDATDSRASVRQQLKLSDTAKLVLNMGYADERKGFDIFVQAAKRIQQQHTDIHFCWVGKRSRAMNRWLKKTIGKSLKGKLHLIDYTADVAPWYAAADCLYLSSREDPFPSVVLEAMSLGLPVMIHSDATGFDEPLLELAYQASSDNPAMQDEVLVKALYEDQGTLPQARKQLIHDHYQIEEYGSVLLQLLSDEYVK